MDYMNNTKRNYQDNIIIQYKKRIRANDSMNKYKKKNQNLTKKQNIEKNIENEDLPLRRSKPQLTEIPSRFNSYKFKSSRAYTPITNLRRKNFYINRHINHNNTFYENANRINYLYDDLYDVDRLHTHRKIYRNYSRPNYFNTTEINNSFIRRRYNSIKDNIKAKKLITLNKILNKKYDDIKVNDHEKDDKIKELKKDKEKLNLKIQSLKSENQNLKLNLTHNELETKNREIIELNKKIKDMRSILVEKENIIINLNNEINEIKNQNYNNLQNQVNNFKIKYKSMFSEKQKIEQLLKQQLIQEKQKYQNLENNFKKEQEKLNNYASLNKNLKISLDNMQRQYQNSINEKDQEIYKLIEEKNGLNSKIIELNNYLKSSVFSDSNFNINTQIEMNIANKQLSEENINLKNKITLLEKEKGELLNNLNKFLQEKNDLIKENSELKEKLKFIQAGKDEGFVNNLDNLKEELNNKKLIEENKLLRKKGHNNYYNINNEEDKKIDLNNKEKNPFINIMHSEELNVADKIRIFKERIKECQQIKKSDEIQIKTLKEEIKTLKEKIKNLETLFNQALNNYKPKKKEQKDALNKIINIFNNFQGIKP